MLATKSVKQSYVPSDKVMELLEQFRLMVNNCIEIGMLNNISSLKALSSRAYQNLGVMRFHPATNSAQYQGPLEYYHQGKIIKKRQIY